VTTKKEIEPTIGLTVQFPLTLYRKLEQECLLSRITKKKAIVAALRLWLANPVYTEESGSRIDAVI